MNLLRATVHSKKAVKEKEAAPGAVSYCKIAIGLRPGRKWFRNSSARPALSPASDILGDVTSQRQLESHALIRLQHANDPQYKRQQPQKAQQHYTDSETAPVTKATEPPKDPA